MYVARELIIAQWFIVVANLFIEGNQNKLSGSIGLELPYPWYPLAWAKCSLSSLSNYTATTPGICHYDMTVVVLPASIICRCWICCLQLQLKWFVSFKSIQIRQMELVSLMIIFTFLAYEPACSRWTIRHHLLRHPLIAGSPEHNKTYCNSGRNDCFANRNIAVTRRFGHGLRCYCAWNMIYPQRSPNSS